MEAEFRARRAWFDDHLRSWASSAAIGERCTCPCCGYPTLSERGGYQICVLDKWEDDGQDDPLADEVWGGPNGGFSLTDARIDFSSNLIMSERWRTRVDRREELEAKRAMIAAFEAMRSAEPSEVSGLWEAVAEQERILADLLTAASRARRPRRARP